MLKNLKNVQISKILIQAKAFDSNLWNVERHKWEDKHFAELERIRSGKPIVEKPVLERIKKPHLQKKVMRISDEEIFESAAVCAFKEGISASHFYAIMAGKIRNKKNLYKYI